MNYDLTVIICATKLDLAYNVCKNVEETSHVKCQFLIYDNTKDHFPIAKVYNMYTKIALADIILFAHLDIEFTGNTWFKEISKKFKEKNCGAIGFAGSIYRPKNYFSGWGVAGILNRSNYIQTNKGNLIYSANKKFEEVVNLDGLAIFSTRSCALKFPFDEKMLNSFHCYDIDYTMTLFNNGYNIYVYANKDNAIFHKSQGKYNKDWVILTYKITTEKWNDLLPLNAQNITITEEINNEALKNNKDFLIKLKRYKLDDKLLKVKNILKNETDTYEISELLKTYKSQQNNGYNSWN